MIDPVSTDRAGERRYARASPFGPPRGRRTTLAVLQSPPPLGGWCSDRVDRILTEANPAPAHSQAARSRACGWAQVEARPGLVPCRRSRAARRARRRGIQTHAVRLMGRPLGPSLRTSRRAPRRRELETIRCPPRSLLRIYWPLAKPGRSTSAADDSRQYQVARFRGQVFQE
jgi:hypothetical protein